MRLREAKMEKKSKLQRHLETSAKGRPAKTRQIAKDKRARRSYKWRMRASKAGYAVGGATRGALIGGIVGSFVDKYRGKPTRADVSANAPKKGQIWQGIPQRVVKGSAVLPGLVVGAVGGAIHGGNKAGKSWHQSRRHGRAVDKAYSGLADRQYKKRRKQSMTETYYGGQYNQSYAAPATPAPVTTTKSHYTKEKRKKDKTSWNRKYKPNIASLKSRVVDYHQSRRSGIGSTIGGVAGGVAGVVAGAVGGYKAGNWVDGSQPMGSREALSVIGGIGGGIAGAIGAGAIGHRLGFKSGTKRGRAVTRMIPSRRGPVRKLQTHEPGEAKRWFPKQGKEAKKHKKMYYHKDYATKTHSTTASVEGGQINIKQSTAHGRSRRRGSVKTGFAKHGYYREDVIEGVIGKMKRTVTGERKATGKRVRAAIEKSKDARYAHRKGMHMKKFMRGKSPKNKIDDKLAAMLDSDAIHRGDWEKGNKTFSRARKFINRRDAIEAR
jgi:hypothetical protein